jgi:aspartyl/glutamyl-tRNA(Asn/Gln) amidotransferase C subunit
MISKEDIEGLAELARLNIKDTELETLQKDINNILGYVGQVSGFSAESTKLEAPLLHNIMRDDLPCDMNHPLSNKEEAVRAQFPKREGDYNVVKKIIQKDE